MHQRVDWRAQQKYRAVGEEQCDRRPARYQRLVARAPELMSREPRIGRDDQRGELPAQLGARSKAGPLCSEEPKAGTRDQGSGKRFAAIEDPRAVPGHAERREQQDVGQIDRNEIRHRAVEPVQQHRGGAQQMRARPPGDGLHARVLQPHQQQQQTEDNLDVDGEQEQRVDFERHPSWPTARIRNTPPFCLAVQALQTMKVPLPLRRRQDYGYRNVYAARVCETATQACGDRPPKRNRREALAVAPMFKPWDVAQRTSSAARTVCTSPVSAASAAIRWSSLWPARIAFAVM